MITFEVGEAIVGVFFGIIHRFDGIRGQNCSFSVVITCIFEAAICSIKPNIFLLSKNVSEKGHPLFQQIILHE